MHTAAMAQEREAADTVMDLGGHLVMPGLVNTHTHVVGAITKAMTEDVSGFGGAFKIALPLHEHYVRKEDVYLPGLLHAVEMLRTGTTTINECWWHQPEPAKVIRDSGLRGVVGAEVREMGTGQEKRSSCCTLMASARFPFCMTWAFSAHATSARIAPSWMMTRSR